jgi:hypothetical protein
MAVAAFTAVVFMEAGAGAGVAVVGAAAGAAVGVAPDGDGGAPAGVRVGDGAAAGVGADVGIAAGVGVTIRVGRLRRRLCPSAWLSRRILLSRPMPAVLVAGLGAVFGQAAGTTLAGGS